MGKTTLLSCIAGMLQPDSGNIEFGYKVQHAVFEQEQVRVLNPNKTVLDEVEGVACFEMRPKVQALLGAFLFPGDDVYKKTKVLSGGERNRVAMAKVLAQTANVLLLDEPTNHLDLQAKAILLSALRQYSGTILFVSHDRNFVEKLATSIIALENGQVSLFPGTYESFLYKQSQKENISSGRPRRKKEVKFVQQTHKNQREQNKKIAKLERKMAFLESEKKRLEHLMGNVEYGSEAYAHALEQFGPVVAQLKTVMSEWELLYVLLNP